MGLDTERTVKYNKVTGSFSNNASNIDLKKSKFEMKKNDWFTIKYIFWSICKDGW